MRLPQQLAGSGLYRIGPCQDIAEIQHGIGRSIIGIPWGYDQRGANLGAGLEAPLQTTSLGIQRAHGTVIAAEINVAAPVHRLRTRPDGIGVGERPLHFQLGHICCGQPAAFERLKSAVDPIKTRPQGG